MRQDGVFTNNKAEIIGKVVSGFIFSHEVYGEDFYNFLVEVPRLSDAVDTLPVTVSERIVDRKALGLGALVRVAGQIRSYNNVTSEKRRNKLVLTLFAREVEGLTSSSAQNPNSVYLNGFICKPPHFRCTPFGREISDILFAVNRPYHKSDYIPCIAWGRNARFAGGLSVGDNMEIWGRMQSRNYQKKYEDGSTEEKIAYEISIAQIEYFKKEPEEFENLL